jgi:hypothetical protein
LLTARLGLQPFENVCRPDSPIDGINPGRRCLD